jgi:hypothetical protein
MARHLLSQRTENLKHLLITLLLAASFVGTVTPGFAKIEATDLQGLTGAQWKGELTYLDYRKNTKTTIRSNLTVTQSAQDKLSYVFEFQYPDEPRADSKETITVGKDGLTLGDEALVERILLADKTLKIVTEKNGNDNGKKSLYRFTYLIGDASFSIRKEALPEGATEFFERNQYSWKR